MINTSIGKYKISKLIGEGGMASVYEAEHEMLGTKVAIKVLNPILSANAEIKTRFRNEAKLMASLDHPNITKVIDFDEQPQQLSIVMEFLNGEDLDQKIKRNGPLSEKEISDIFSQTLSAFQYAHEKGIVHRDIKPSNIYILSNGHVKILDFGIAKLFGQGNEMTQTGTQMGTPIYMSPEQVKGDKSIDHRSDIYSLGVTMFFAINGKPPYNSTTESQFDIFTKIVYQELPEFSIQSKFNEMVLKACNKNREDRFQRCSEWLNQINNPSSAHSSSPINLDKTLMANNISDDTTQAHPHFSNNINTSQSEDITQQETQQKVNASISASVKLHHKKKSKKGFIIGAVAGVILLIIFLVVTREANETQGRQDQSNLQNTDSTENVTNKTADTNQKSAVNQTEDPIPVNEKKIEMPITEIKIGNQVWMTQNLNVQKFRNGDPIPEAKTYAAWKTANDNQQPAWCYYENNQVNGTKFGKLYNWYAVNDKRVLAPSGWRVSSVTDFENLINFVGDNASFNLKSKESWLDNGNGTNETGFNSLGCGYRTHEGVFMGRGKEGSYWSSNDTGVPFAWRVRFTNSNEIQYLDILKSFGFSVRCLRN